MTMGMVFVAFLAAWAAGVDVATMGRVLARHIGKYIPGTHRLNLPLAGVRFHADQLLCQAREAVHLSRRPSVLNGDILALDVTEVAQPM
jgi:hypothetical protein